MNIQYQCKNKNRYNLIKDNSSLNGIDFLEIDPNQTTLYLHFINSITNEIEINKENFLVEGGTRIRNIHVSDLKPSNDKILILTVDQPGDFSTYTLCIVDSKDSNKPPEWIDPILSVIDFSFKVNCPSDFDCKPIHITTPETLPEPRIDYMAKDYNSFRQLMLDRLSLIMPDWKERNPSDLSIALIELLAYAGDQLSYYQDAVATEAYLGTARKRISVHRHARLLDYPMHDGCNARAWVQIQVNEDQVVIPGPKPDENKPGTLLLTKINDSNVLLAENKINIEKALKDGAQAFETMHDITLYKDHNEMHFYTWGDEGCCLPKGATCATLKGYYPYLKKNDVLIFEERLSPATGLATEADPAHRHAVRLTRVKNLCDPLFSNKEITEIEWHAEDALPFPLCVHKVIDPNTKEEKPVSVVLGNIVLADHGRTIKDEKRYAVPNDILYRPCLTHRPVTQQSHVRKQMTRNNKTIMTEDLVPYDEKAPASAAFKWEMHHVRPVAKLIQNNQSIVWKPQRDLLESDRFACEFVVEVEEDNQAYLRFGNNILGQKPSEDTTFNATYRIGNGRSGNVGTNAIAHIIIRSDSDKEAITDKKVIKSIRNPMPAKGGVDPETIEQVKQYASQAFRCQERAVNAADYAAMTEQHPDVQKAAATIRWTGSWHTVFVTIDRKGGKSVDKDFIQEIKDYLDCYRMAGYDIEVTGPQFVPLDISMEICLDPGHYGSNVKADLLDIFSNRDLPDGRKGFFYPDNFTFGQPVYLSRIYAAAMSIDGVASVDMKKFQRWGKTSNKELDEGKLTVGRLEVVCLDNDPNFPEKGKIEFIMKETYER